jgi:serine/threonine-protein kinase
MAMPDQTSCPDCGAAMPPTSPGGLCLCCLLRAVLADPSGSGWNAAPAASATNGSILDSITATVGPVPRVLLRDTTPDEEPGPIVRPRADGADSSIRYRIDGEIARGGMGAILKGRDPDLGRDVALKVLREDHRENTDMVRRFVEEAQIGGQLQHPGVVPIYELGTFADRRPFFAMKLVKGRTLAALLEERRLPDHKPEAPAKGSTDGPSPALQACRERAATADLPRFLSIFEAVCQTVAYAHARGVIHRDLKPSNVMVGTFGEVQVMDWGLAKVLPRGGPADDATTCEPERQETVISTARSDSDDPGLSHTGTVLGTPSYMAPEQARGEIELIDERADVFALGSILCELLTGEPAFTGQSSQEITRKASRGDLAEACSRLDRCDADAKLVGLARDCLASEAEDRPRHAGAVAGRVTAHLAGVQERVRAAERERAVAEARAIEERRRRKVQLALAASVLALTTLGGLSTTYYLQQRSARAASLERGSGEALTLRAVAEQEPEKVERWEAVAAAWRQAEAALGLGSDPQAAEIVAAHMRDAQEHVDAARRDRALLEAGDDVRANKEDLGLDGADAAYAQAFRKADLDLDTLSPAEVGARLRARPASVTVAATAALDDWALVRLQQKREDARSRRPLHVARAADPEPFRDRVRAALLDPDDATREAALEKLAAEPEAAELPPSSAVLLAASLKDHAAAVGLLRSASSRHPDDAWVNYTLAKRLGGLRPAPREEQVRYYSMARAAHPRIGHDLADLLEAMGRSDEALAVFADLAARLPGNPWHLAGYGRCLKAHRRLEAAAVLERAVTVAHEAIKHRPDDILARFSLYAALALLGRLDESIAEIEEVIRRWPDLADAHYNLGHALALQEKLDEAVAAYRKAIRLRPDLADAHHGLGHALNGQGKLDKAIGAFREAIGLRPDLAEAHYGLGYALVGQGELEQAIAEYHKAIGLRPDLAEAHHTLGYALAGQGKSEAAIAEYREAIGLRPDLAEAHYGLSKALRRRGDYAGALAALRNGHELRSSRPGWPNPWEQWIPEAERLLALSGRLSAVLEGTDRPHDNSERLGFATLCYDAGRYAAAVRLWAEALESDPKLGEDRRARHRYNAACAAALATAGGGKDEPTPNGTVRAKLRAQALAWMKAERNSWAEMLDTASPQARAAIVRTLLFWKVDSDLAGVRAAAAVAKLPEPERKEWQALWADVDRLLKQAQSP